MRARRSGSRLSEKEYKLFTSHSRLEFLVASKTTTNVSRALLVKESKTWQARFVMDGSVWHIAGAG